MITIYGYHQYSAYSTGETQQIEDDAEVPMYWLTHEPPVPPDGQYVVALPPGWTFTPNPPPTDPVPVTTAPEQIIPGGPSIVAS